MFSLTDKVALVTGASRGIGRATSLALAEAGAKVAVTSRTLDKLAVLATEIKQAGGQALAVPMDVSDAASVKNGFQHVIENFGRIDILVNNAAITKDMLELRMKLEDWEAVLRTNSDRRAFVHSAGAFRDDPAEVGTNHQCRIRCS